MVSSATLNLERKLEAVSISDKCLHQGAHLKCLHMGTL